LSLFALNIQIFKQMSNKVDFLSRWCRSHLESEYNYRRNVREETMYSGSLEYMKHKKDQRDWIENQGYCDNCVHKYKMLISRTCDEQFKSIKIK
jgi:hypothetical protein